MGKYQGYEKYKDSGVEWLREIPESWGIIPFNFLINTRKGIAFKSADFIDTGCRVVKASDIKNYSILESDIYLDDYFKQEYPKAVLQEGEIVLSTVGSIPNVKNSAVGQIGIVPKNLSQCLLNQNTVVFKANEQYLLNKFLFYILISNRYRDHLDLYAHGTANQASLNISDMLSFKSAIPPLDEQESIAYFLDRKTSQIDALIAKKAALLEKLDEKRTALISHAVTKGLDRNVPMKDSGVEWLGNIPEHWTVSKARFVSSIFVPQRNKPELNSDEGLPWVTMDDMSSERIKETLFKVSDIAFKIAGSKMLKKNSVIASCIGNFGICAINDVDVIINQQLQAFIPFSTISSEYLCEIVGISNDYFKMIATAATVVYVNQAGFANMPILLPPKEEQEEIINFIVLKREKIDLQKAKVKEAIELLKEYRTALITNAVTGKIDVRQVANV